MNAEQVSFDLEERFRTVDFQSDSSELFDLASLGVVQIGTFNSLGAPENWEFSVGDIPDMYADFMKDAPVMSLQPLPTLYVYIRGVFSLTLTNERRIAAGLEPL